MNMKRWVRWALMLAVAGGLGVGEGGGVGETIIDISQPKVVPKGVLLKPYIQAEKPIPWEKYSPGLPNSGWIDTKTNWKYAYYSNIVGSWTAVYNPTLNKSLGIGSANYSAFLNDIIYVAKMSHGIDSDDDIQFKTERFKQDEVYYAHPEIIVLDTLSGKYQTISFYAWASYGDEGGACGLGEKQSWIIAEVKKLNGETVIDFQPVGSTISKKCNMTFRFFVNSHLGVYQ